MEFLGQVRLCPTPAAIGSQKLILFEAQDSLPWGPQHKGLGRISVLYAFHPRETAEQFLQWGFLHSSEKTASKFELGS